jgi:hypothetical protein
MKIIIIIKATIKGHKGKIPRFNIKARYLATWQVRWQGKEFQFLTQLAVVRCFGTQNV